MSGIKQLGNYVTAYFKLGRTERMAKQASRGLVDLRQEMADQRAHVSDTHSDHVRQFDDISRQLNETVEQMSEFTNGIAAVSDQLDCFAAIQSHRQQSFEDRMRDATHSPLSELKVRHAELARSYTALSGRLDTLLLQFASGSAGAPVVPPTADVGGLSALNASVQQRLQALLPQTTKEDLSPLLPIVEEAVLRAGETPVLDLYQGDGTWLGLLGQAGLPAQAAHGLLGSAADVWSKEVRSALETQDDESLSVVSARHIVACLPFEELLWLMREVMRVLAPGGMVLIETPDPVHWGADFYDDPDRLRPVTQRTLQAVLETLGFEQIQAQHLKTKSLVLRGSKPSLEA